MQNFHALLKYQHKSQRFIFILQCLCTCRRVPRTKNYVHGTNNSAIICGPITGELIVLIVWNVIVHIHITMP